MKITRSDSPRSHNIDERDVLLQGELRREPRVRSSILGDKKLTLKDAVLVSEPAVKLAQPKSEQRQVSEHKTRAGRLAEPHARLEIDDPILHSPGSTLKRERGFNKVSPQGGKRIGSATGKQSAVDEVRARVARKLIYRGLGLTLLLVGFAVAAYFVSDPLARLLERPLKSVAVEGQFHYLPKDRAMELIAKEIDGDFLQLNLNRLKESLEADPWVDRVSLSRRWPDTLVVKIAEQTPIARWDENGFLNQRGEIIRVQETDKLIGLTWLQGSEQNAREIMQQYQDISSLMRTRGLEIVALACDSKKSWRLTLKNDKEIAVGREEVMEKLRRFVTVYDIFLSSVWSDVKAIDVRYSNGVAVQWIPGSETANKYLTVDTVIPKK